MVEIKAASTSSDLEGILELQWANHLSTISSEQKSKEGFVTVRHTMEQLEVMNSIASHIIAINQEKVVGYILAMTKASKNLVPVLVPMFEQFDQIKFKEKKVAEMNYMVIGQICVGKNQRGSGLFDQMYKAYKEAYSPTYEFAITEIALSNTRSLAAHQRVGFKTIHEFADQTQQWAIVAWDWK